MNNTLVLVSSLLFAATLVTTSAARPSRDDQVSNHARIVTDELVPLPGIRHIKLGMTREQVLSFQGNRRPDNMERPSEERLVRQTLAQYRQALPSAAVAAK
jgi:hypothetical protein